MKIRIVTALCVLALLFSMTVPAQAEDNSVEVISDFVIVRPGCLVATVVGSVIFVAALPIAASSKSVKKTARTLVVNPAKATFTRPLGDFSGLKD